jgi:UDP-3-O-[3-hydroxymyristoyl] glucosamine N-acyltransferase
MLNGCSSWDQLVPNTLTFAVKFCSDFVLRANQADVFVIASEKYRNHLTCGHLIMDDPRLAYSLVVTKFFTTQSDFKIADSAKIGDEVQLGSNVSIGEYAVITGKVTIGDYVTIGHHVILSGPLSIGDHTVIKPSSVIGENGFGFAKDESGIPHMIPHRGGVTIGRHCLIGSLCSINRGVIKDTTLGDYVMLDDHVFVGHNAVLEDRVTVTGFSNVGGGNTLCEDCWIGPNSTLMNGNIKINRAAMVGIGSLVLRSVPAAMVVQGNPARTVWPRKGWEHLLPAK